MLITTVISTKRFRKQIVFGIILLFMGVSVFQQIQFSLKASLTDGLPDGINIPSYIGYPPTIQLLYPTEGESVNRTFSLQWTAQDAEDGMNLSIYLYLSTDYGKNCTPFLNNPYENSGEVLWNTTQYPNGEYTLVIEAQDSNGQVGIDNSNFQINNYVEQLVNTAPIRPNQPFGKVYNRMGHDYSYTTSTTDPDGNLVYYLWDWGDGNLSGWLGPYHSGVNCEAHHTWIRIGIYNIMVKAKDGYGTESIWSAPLSVTIPYNYNPIRVFLDLLFQQFPYAFPFLQKLLGY
jgi:PKD domain/Bacterial Ig domain